jgi:chromosome segregation ATPase
MSTDDGWRHRLKLLGPDNLNALDRWRMDVDRLEQERAQPREQRKRDGERHERQIARASAREEIAALRAELAALRAEHESLCVTLRDTMNVTADVFDTLGSQCRDLSRECEGVRELKAEVARLSGRKEEFQFAREKGGAEVTDLPGFLPRRTVN